MHKVAFFSMKGGVGKTTAAFASALWFSKQRKKVVLVDFDFNSPGLTANFQYKLPKYGITDWFYGAHDDVHLNDILIEMEKNNFYIIPMYGGKTKNCYLPSISSEFIAELLEQVETTLNPDVVLIDFGIGKNVFEQIRSMNIDDILLFANRGSQTWNLIHRLFVEIKYDYLTNGKDISFREKLKVVSIIPNSERRLEYLDDLIHQSYNAFMEIYNEIEPGEVEGFNFEWDDNYAPHYPIEIKESSVWYNQERLETPFEMLKGHKKKDIEEMEQMYFYYYKNLFDYINQLI